MRKLDTIIVHCSATPPDREVGIDEIRTWHLQRGFSDVGYHYHINRKGVVEVGRPIDKAGAHTRGANDSSVGICLAGGVDRSRKPDSNFTLAQLNTLASLIKKLKQDYPEIEHLKGHRDYANKACPSFDINALLGNSWR